MKKVMAYYYIDTKVSCEYITNITSQMCLMDVPIYCQYMNIFGE